MAAVNLEHADTAFSTGNSSFMTRLGDEESMLRTSSLEKASPEDFAADVDHFVPLPPIKGKQEEQANPLTIRAIVIGCILGVVLNAASLYSGLRNGISVASELFAAILGFVIIQAFTKILPHIPVIGGPFGPKENGLIQAAARGAAGTSAIFSNMVPALFQAKLLTTPTADFGKLVLLVLPVTFFGLFSAVPLRKFFIIDAARDLNLRFPSSEALALTIHAMHDAGSGARKAMVRFNTLAYAFLAAFIQRVASSYAIGLLYDWHIFTWIFIWGNYQNAALNAENWGWYLELSPQSLGIGMLIGINISTSFLVAAVLSWGVIGPLLVHYGVCFGVQRAPLSPQWQDYMTFAAGGPVQEGDVWVSNPYYWILWSGIAILLASGITEMILNLPYFYKAAKGGCTEVYNKVSGKARRRNFFGDLGQDVSDPSERTVPTWVWGPGLVTTLLATCLIMHFQWQINAGYIIVTLLLAAIFCFMNLTGVGLTGLSPMTAIIVLIAIICGCITAGQQLALIPSMTFNLATPVLVVGVVEFSQYLVEDFRIGYLLDTPPILQFYAQAIGTLVSAFVSTGVFTLYATAWPCIVNGGVGCPFQMPGVATTMALIPFFGKPSLNVPIPSSALWFALACAILVVFETVTSRLLLTGKRAHWRQWMPNWFGIGFGFIMPSPVMAITVFIGAASGYIWHLKSPSSYSDRSAVLAAGLISGESMGGFITAILEIAGIGGGKYGTRIGCPANTC